MKVKRKKITQELKHGGLNMVDIESIFRSLKQCGYRGFSSPTPVFMIGFN